MGEDLRRTEQRSIRLNEMEAQQADGLIGYRGLWDFSDLVRAGLQLLLDAEHDDYAARGTTGAAKRREEKKGGRKS